MMTTRPPPFKTILMNENFNWYQTHIDAVEGQNADHLTTRPRPTS